MAKAPLVVGVGGGSAAGKTTVVRGLLTRLGDAPVSVLEQDRYYRDRSALQPSARESVNFDHPDALELALLGAHLRVLRDGRPVDVPRYDFTRHLRTPNTDRIAPGRVIIVEGILVLADADLRALIDIKVFVEADDATRLARRLQRDVAERGRSPASVRAQFAMTVRPMHRQHVEPSRRHADLVVPGTAAGAPTLDALVDLVVGRLKDEPSGLESG